jgi:hypothetical protein
MKLQRKSGDSNQKRQFPSGIVFSGFVIGFSFIAMVLPLALFHLAQIAATLRLRTALTLLFSVVAAVLLLGTLVQHQAILSGGLAGLFWAPLFAFALHQRLRGGPLWASALVLCLPALLMLLFAYTTPSAEELETSFRTVAEMMRQQTVQPAQTSVEQAAPMLDLFSTDGPAFAILRDFAALDGWQRLSWFVFGKGAPIFLAALAIGLTNLVFLDFGVEQVERLRAVARYVRTNERKFSPRLVEGLKSLAVVKAYEEGDKPHLEVTASRPFDDSADYEERPVLSLFFRPRQPSHLYQVWGFEFNIRFPSRAWQLRNLSIPAALVFGAVLFFGGLLLSLGAPESVIKAAKGALGAPLALGGLAAMVILAVVAIQGLIVALERLAPNTILIALVGALLISVWFPTNLFFLLAGFGILGILDYAYDFRGCLAKYAKAV